MPPFNTTFIMRPCGPLPCGKAPYHAWVDPSASIPADLTDLSPSCPPLEGDGTHLYVSCLSYLDAVPPGVITTLQAPLDGGGGRGGRRSPDSSDPETPSFPLPGAVSTRALCLLSRRPRLDTMERALRALSDGVLLGGGTGGTVSDLIHHLIARVPDPDTVQAQVGWRRRLGGVWGDKYKTGKTREKLGCNWMIFLKCLDQWPPFTSIPLDFSLPCCLNR